ncbi:DNA mismatch repair endonuclease MutL [Halobellus limi]|uniref:DNA mismatch repair protein MutL n=1 Tax=Halobellus limi TaxID=699433 RepID=A0A4D6H724_9EURY|nr:DNA mismatch repair endonuclease MutL [Halobellus limi]QCC48982.1 DNA mismatch repair endonuclease MutL [Halobellus limi]
MRELDDRTVRQIAAGEVVERPASVVKELVENSLDADADRISVAVDAGGTEGVRVRDDGVGMDRESAERAVEEHTTSKIDGIDDLEAGVGTLGFRGEALHTIGAVSRLTIRTKPRARPGDGGNRETRGGDASGTEIRIEGGEVTAVGAAGCPEGTVVEVEDLFFNTPARKKFLKTTATEFDHVNTVVTHYALANPDVAISLEHDGREVFATEGRGSLRSAVLSVYGREVAESMIEVDAEPDSTDATATVERVRGLVSHPETTRSTREYLSTFVNGRYVTDGVLREAVLDAYGGQLASDRYPFAVLFVDVPAGTVDVNVHPRKMEIRFDDESGVRTAVTDAVRTALLDEGLIRSTAPRGRSAPDETEVRPESPTSEVRGGAGHGPPPATADGDAAADSDDVADSDAAADPDADGEGSLAEPESGSRERGPATGVDPTDDDAWTVDGLGGERSDPTAESASEETDLSGNGSDSDWSGNGSGSDLSPGLDADRSAGSKSGAADAEASSPSTARDDPDSRSSSDRRQPPEKPPNAEGRSTSEAPAADGADGRARSGGQGESPRGSRPTGIVGPTVQRDLRGESATLEPRFDSLPSMRILGQLHDTYVVAEADSGLILVDQHAADERVNYERLRAELDGDVVTQALAEPVELELTAREAALFDAYEEALSDLGFRSERVDDRTVAVRSVPAVFAEALDPQLVRDVLSAFVAEGDGGAETVEAVADDLLADLACYPSVTGNTSLTEGSVVELLEALDDCENPYACPHGRPVVIHIDGDEIGDRFERDYPGH